MGAFAVLPPPSSLWQLHRVPQNSGEESIPHCRLWQLEWAHSSCANRFSLETTYNKLRWIKCQGIEILLLVQERINRLEISPSTTCSQWTDDFPLTSALHVGTKLQVKHPCQIPELPVTSTVPQAQYHLDSLNNKQSVMCLRSCVQLQWLVGWPISIDKDSHVYKQAEHRPSSTFLFRSQNGSHWGGSFYPHCSTE